MGKMMGFDPVQRCSIVKGAEQAGTPMAAKGDSTGPGPRGSGLLASSPFLSFSHRCGECCGSVDQACYLAVELMGES